VIHLMVSRSCLSFCRAVGVLGYVYLLGELVRVAMFLQVEGSQVPRVFKYRVHWVVAQAIWRYLGMSSEGHLSFITKGLEIWLTWAPSRSPLVLFSGLVYLKTVLIYPG